MSLIKKIIPKHDIYVDLFANGVDILLAKDVAKTEILNSQNFDIYNLYKVIQNYGHEFISAIKALEQVNFRRKMLEEDFNSDVERAVCFYLTILKNNKVDEQALRKLTKRLKSVNIQNSEYKTCVFHFNSDNTFFFVRPSSAHFASFLDMLDVLKDINGKVMIHCFADSYLLSQLKKREFVIKQFSKNANVFEVLALNYEEEIYD